MINVWELCRRVLFISSVWIQTPLALQNKDDPFNQQKKRRSPAPCWCLKKWWQKKKKKPHTQKNHPQSNYTKDFSCHKIHQAGEDVMGSLGPCLCRFQKLLGVLLGMLKCCSLVSDRFYENMQQLNDLFLLGLLSCDKPSWNLSVDSETTSGQETHRVIP